MTVVKYLLNCRTRSTKICISCVAFWFLLNIIMNFFKRNKKKEGELSKSTNKLQTKSKKAQTTVKEQNTDYEKEGNTEYEKEQNTEYEKEQNAILEGQNTKYEKEQNTEYEKEQNARLEGQKPASTELIVAAIDFGTTFSGWAFSFHHDFKTDPTKASVKQWHSGSGTLTTEKTPTVALINPDGKTLRAFGYDAENEYKDLAGEEEHEKYYYFQRFKMLLHKKLGQKLDRTVTLEDAMGRSLPALDVFSLSIEYLTNDMMKVVNDRLAGKIKSEDILWVITVPAIWTDGAKQFMREAAVKAGIKTKKLIIALEPETASVFCRHLSVDTTVDKREVSLATFPDGTKYIVLDAGGGTIDITVHEVVPGGLKEIRAASGGDWGGTMVDKAFKTLLTDIFGEDTYDCFKEEDTEDWLDLWRDFEVKKRGISSDKTAKISMKFPISLINMFEERKGRKLSTAIASTKYAENVTFAGDKLKFSPNVFQNLFKESISLTIDHLKSLVKDIGVRAVLMVGGYSESPMLQHAIKTTFTDVDVVIPLGASSTILRGALVYGHSPHFIKERILKYTYGIGCSSKFIPGVHDPRKLIRTDKGDHCTGTFSKYVEKGQTVSTAERFQDTFYPVYRGQTIIRFPVYASEAKTPMYTDEEGCIIIGEMNVPLENHDGDLSRAVKISLTFSDTENQVEGYDVKSGKKTNAALNFLG